MRSLPIGLKNKLVNTNENGSKIIITEPVNTNSRCETNKVLDLISNETYTTGIQNYNSVELPTMNILDKSASCMYDFMTSLKETNPIDKPLHSDVNAAANCAKQIVNLMNMKLKIIKELKGK